MPRKLILPEVWNVPQIFRDRLGEVAGRQRAMQAEGHLMLIPHAPPGPQDNDRIGRFFWRTPDGVWSSDAFGGGSNAMDKHLSEYATLVEKYEHQNEAAVTADDYFDVIYGLAPLQRSARHLHEVLQDARKMCPEDRDLITQRDRSYQISRMCDLLHNDAKNGLEFSIAKRTEEQAQSSQQMAVSAHRLNMLAAFFFPIVTLTAIFGVNLKHGLEEQSPPLPFAICITLGLICGFVLKAAVNHQPKKP